MFKKILSLALVAMLLMSLIAIGASAAQVEVAEEAAAEDVAAQGAEEDAAATGAGVIKFDANSAGWSNPSAVLFYIYEVGGEELAPWGSKKKLGGTDEGNGIWSFDPTTIGVTDGKQYGIIFQNADAGQTYDLLMDTSCIGDTASCTGNDIENPVDSNQTGKEAKWANSSLGPIKQITSIGNVVGETIPANKTAKSMMTDFLASKGKDGLDNAVSQNKDGLDAQGIIDKVGAALGLNQADVKECIEAAKTTGHSTTGETSDRSGDWDASKSSLPAGSSDGGSSSTSGGGSSSTSGGTSSKTSSTSGSSTTKSGSASNTQTGQEENILFIMLGVMVLAAGVIIFVRKKERA